MHFLVSVRQVFSVASRQAYLSTLSTFSQVNLHKVTVSVFTALFLKKWHMVNVPAFE